ncbi:hypothetical protein A5725_16235 [Mycobacterium kubicae]|uniref:LppA family lipoprotein n=1 Tax=Mycobacterium kubicae TaxID=120959 RepID=UPI0007FC4045|nr:LppA family lipoprotein [Mycobacterium kubicae]OBF20492.1 hypothetical protein A5725_16235 [Mycobacterium kubicae]
MKRAITALLVGTAVLLTGCLKSLDPYANPGRTELDRLQKIVNARPDLEVVQQQLAALDTSIRAAVAKYAPATRFSSTKVAHPTNGCQDPFHRNIGRQERSDHFFGEPAPAGQQWQQIVTELAPVFSAAGFRPAGPAGANDSQLNDGALVTLVNHGDLIDYNYDTGCHLPAAWRTAPPPPEMRPGNDPNVHYPYLYESPGGRSVDAL